MTDALATIEDLVADLSPEDRADHARLALARAVAGALVVYRARHELSQRGLARRLGMTPSSVARLELAEHNPSIETLERLSNVLGLRFLVDVAPASAEPVRLPAGLELIADRATAAGGRLMVAAG